MVATCDEKRENLWRPQRPMGSVREWGGWVLWDRLRPGIDLVSWSGCLIRISTWHDCRDYPEEKGVCKWITAWYVQALQKQVVLHHLERQWQSNNYILIAWSTNLTGCRSSSVSQVQKGKPATLRLTECLKLRTCQEDQAALEQKNLVSCLKICADPDSGWKTNLLFCFVNSFTWDKESRFNYRQCLSSSSSPSC